MTTKTVRSTSQRARAFGLKTLKETVEREIDWIWYPYFARGEMTLVEGDPEAKKSFLIQAAARSLMDGRELPSQYPDLQAEPGNIVFFDCENDGETVLKKRMRYLRLRNDQFCKYKEDPFEMVDGGELDDIIDVLRAYKPLMVIFDTMNDYFKKDANTNTGKDVAQGLQPFKRMAKELNCSVVLIRHLTKGSQGSKAMYRGSGSVSFIGKARLGISVAADPKDKERSLFVPNKTSNAVKPKARAYEVRSTPRPDARDAFRFMWGEEVDMTADEILSAERPVGRPAEKREDATEWLMDELADGPVPAKELKSRCERRNISFKTVERAADECGRVIKTGGPGSLWKLRA